MDTPETTLVASDLFFPEGPVAMDDGTLLCVELGRRSVDRVHPDGRVEVVSENGGSPNGLAIGPDGAVYVCNSGGWDFVEVMGFRITDVLQPADYSGGRIERVDLATGEVRVLYTECDGHPLMGPNDIVFDEHGGMWFTDHGKIRERDLDHGGVYYAQPDGSSIREVVYPLESPNGIGLSPDGTKLYVAETHTGRLWSWDVTAPGELARNPIARSGGSLLVGLPGFQLFDSLAVDSEGNVIVGTLVNGGLTIVSPDGSSVDHMALPDFMVTNVCFGGLDLRTAYATCSAGGTILSFEWPRPGLRLAYNA
jgi:gluconolactonase